MFYTYRQNNSGGYWEYDTLEGVAQYVIIEAPTQELANLKFWDVVSGYTSYCECCGERWSDYYPDDAEVPSIYDKPVDEYLSKADSWFRSSDPKKPTVAIHYLDGTIELKN